MSSSARIIDYLGEGTHAGRPSVGSLNLPSGCVAFYAETDTLNTYAAIGGAWVQVNGGSGRATYSSVILADSPTFYYQCRDLSGTTCTDASGNSNNGVYTNTPLLGHATLCGDVSDYAIHAGANSGNIGITTTTLPNTSAFTIEGIFKVTKYTDTGHNGRMFATGGFGDATGFALAFYSGNDGSGGFYLTFNVATSGSLNTVRIAQPYYIAFDRTHVALVFTGSATIVYVNGVALYTSSAMSGAYLPNGSYSNKLYIGQDVSTTECFVGAYDELALYGSALSASQIRTHAAAMWTQ